jgi:NAD(P)-dependent dehydrogenase (short-subunit alcohol dehydrogenase family)
MLVARTAADIESVAAEIESANGSARTYVADVTDDVAAIASVRAAEACGDLRVVVNAAGINRQGPAQDYPMADWDLLFAVNVRATFVVCRAVGAGLLERGVSGSIINVSSQMGCVGYPGRSAYCATKHAVDGLTRALAVEWAPHDVRVNAVAPTFVETPMTARMFSDAAFRADVLRRLPTGHLASVEDVAHGVRYLACDASSAVTGHILRIDNGWTAW